MRDLGASLSVGLGLSTKVSRARFIKAGCSMHRVFALPHDHQEKLHIFRATCHAAALYGCEATHIDETALAQYSSKLAHYLSPQSVRSSNAMVYTTNSKVDDDPSIIIAIKRIVTFRRMMIRWPGIHHRVDNIMRAYKANGTSGILYDNTDVHQLQPSSPTWM